MKKILSFITIALLALTCTACGSDPSGISKAEFDEIHTGQTYSDVVDIVGGEGTKVAETEEEFDDYIEFTHTYKFNGENGGYAEFVFTKTSYKDVLKMNFDDAELTSKNQYDLS